MTETPTCIQHPAAVTVWRPGFRKGGALRLRGVAGWLPGGDQVKAVAIELNVLERSLPTAVTAVMMTTAIKAAMRPYSMAVTPD
jgi:hypothetical protein